MFRFLGVFDKLRKEIISYVMSVCSYIRLLAWDNSVQNERIFVELDIWKFFENISKTSRI